MRIKTGVEKGNSDTSTGKSLIGIHPQRRRQHQVVLFEDYRVRFDLSQSAREKLKTTRACLVGINRGGVRLENRSELSRARGQRKSSLRLSSRTPRRLILT